MFNFVFILLISLFGTAISSKNEKTKADPYFEEWKENAWKRPSKCHVCKLLVTELYVALNRTNKKDILHTGYHLDAIDNSKKTINYERSEIRLMESMEDLCNSMKSYVSRARRKFPYVKGVKSHFREGLDNLVKNSKVKLNIEAPEDMVDDNTKEIIRLKFKCVHMLEEHEDDITEWYMNNSEQNLMDWLCKHRVLKHENQECLNESDELLAPEDDTITSLKMDEEDDEIDEASPVAESEEKYGKGDNVNEPEDFHLEL